MEDYEYYVINKYRYTGVKDIIITFYSEPIGEY